jgi:hypothetical protein
MRVLLATAILLSSGSATATKMDATEHPPPVSEIKAADAALSVHLEDDQDKEKHGKAKGHFKEHGNGHAYGHHKLTEVPEPITAALFGFGLLGIGIISRRE